MKIEAAIAFFIAFLFAAGINGQHPVPQRKSDRDQKIKQLMAEEDYADAAAEITIRIDELKTEGLADSLYQYTYNLGKSYVHTYGEESGIAAVEELQQYIRQHDPDSAHWIQVLEDISWIYYETGSVTKRYQIDSAHLALVQQFSRSSPVQLSVAHYNAGFNALELGKPEEAIASFEQSIAPLTPDDSASVNQLVNGYNALGASLWRNGKLNQAKQSYYKSLEFIKLMKDEHEILSNRSNCYGNLALLAQDQGQLIEAENLLKKALGTRSQALTLCKEARDRDQHHRMQIANYRNLAAVHLTAGDYNRALQITNHLYQLQKKHLRPDDPSRYITYESFASIYLHMGEYERAEENILIYKNFCTERFGRFSFYTGGACRRLADIYLARHMFEEAVASFDESLEILFQISGEGIAQDIPMTLLQRASALQQIGRNMQALSDLHRAISIYRKMGIEQFPKLGRAYISLGEFHLKMLNADSAAIYANQAIEILEAQNFDHAVSEGKFTSAVLHLPDAYLLKAEIARLPGNTAPDSTEKYINLAVKILRLTKNHYDIEDAQMVHYNTYRKIFDFAREWCYEQYQRTKNADFLVKFFTLNEENKTILLRRQLQYFGAISFHGVPDSIIQQEQEYSRLLGGMFTHHETTSDYLETREKYDALIAHIRRYYPDYYSLRFDEETATIEQVQHKLLTDDYSLIQYCSTANHLFALIITPDNCHLIQLDNHGLLPMIERYNLFIKEMDVESFAQNSVHLYRTLFQPLEDKLNTPNLIIIPDGDLHRINFETLMRPTEKSQPQYLIHHYNISYLLSATSALQYSQLNRPAKPGVLAFAPGFSDQLKQEYSASFAGATPIDERYQQLIQQPFSLQVAQQIAQIFSGKAYTGNAATESQFKNTNDQFGILHFGTHAIIENAAPMMSRLILAKEPTNSPESEDGYLHAHEIYNLSLQAELAVLAACETGVGKQNRSEGVLSLSHSFAYAGCPSIIMSLWQIDEKTSATITESFYRNLAKGISKSESLRQAKLQYLNSAHGELAAPYFWAGLVLVGNHDKLQNPKARKWWPPYAFIAVSFLGLILLRRVQKRKKGRKGKMVIG